MAFARTAPTIACDGPLQQVLDELAAEVLSASRASTCVVVIVDPDNPPHHHGRRRGPTPRVVRRLEEAQSRGALSLPTMALRSRSQRTSYDLAALVEGDERFAPMRPLVGRDG